MQPLAQPKSLVDQAYDSLLDAICSGVFPPGTRLTQDEIAARLGVSRQPVNSALSILRSHGFVRDTGRRGVVVAPVDSEQFRAIYEYRSAVEPFATRLATRRRPEDAAEQVRRVLDQGRTAVDGGDQAAWLLADRAFHEMIYSWAGNPVIAEAMGQTWHHIRRAMAEVLRDPDAARLSWKEHGTIAAAMLRGDGEGAEALMRAHIETAAARALAVLDAGDEA